MYDLKEKIDVTDTFIKELISSCWQEVESLQQQTANINADTPLGAEVVKLLKMASTNHYVLIGNLECLLDGNQAKVDNMQVIEEPAAANAKDLEGTQEQKLSDYPAEDAAFEPFEYFVDFDDPIGDPMSDKDLYGN